MDPGIFLGAQIFFTVDGTLVPKKRCRLQTFLATHAEALTTPGLRTPDLAGYVQPSELRALI